MGIIGDVLGSVVQGVGMYADYKQEEKQFEYDKQLQQTMFDREDTAVARRAADLKASGLSQTLAAGGAATTMSPIRAQVPGAGIGSQISDQMALRMGMMKQEADISKTKADEQRIKLESAPMKSLQDRFEKGTLSVDPYSGNVLGHGKGVSPIDYLGNVIVSNAAENNRILVSDAEKASYDRMFSQFTASRAKIEMEQAERDFELTKSFGVRSGDKIDAVWETVMRDLGLAKSGAPYASAATQVIGKLFNTIMGLK